MKRCKHCGARSLAPRRTCDFCGTPYVQGFEYPGRSVAKGSGSGFELLLAHPNYQGMLDAGPTVPIPKRRRDGASQGVVILFVGFMILRMLGVLPESGPGQSFLPLVLFVAAGVSILRRHNRQRAFPGTHLESTPAHLIEVFGAGGGTMTATIELPSGERRSLRHAAGPGEKLHTGDYGVAHIKANVLVEFRSLSVNSG